MHTGATSGVTAGHPVGSHVPGTAAHEARVVEKEEEGRGGEKILPCELVYLFLKAACHYLQGVPHKDLLITN